MTNLNANHIVYGPITLDFVTVGVEFCSFLEKTESPSKKEWIKTLAQILPLLYVKATLLPTVETDFDDFLDTVKEAYINDAKARSAAIYRKPMNMLGAMVTNFSEAVMKDNDLRSHYLDENNHINMDAIVNANVVMYTVLEELNTMQMVDVSPQYIKRILKEI